MRSRNKWLLLGVVSALVLVLALASALHGYRNFRAGLRGKTCVHNLQALANQLYLYAQDHEGHFPDKISALYPEYVTDLQMFICPEIREKYKRERGVRHPFSPDPTPEEIDSLSSYAVVPGLSTSDDMDSALAYEKKDNHSNVRRIRVNVAGIGAWDSPEN